MRILVVLGEGGHTRQMLHLLDQLGAQYDYHYLMAAEDTLSESEIRLPGPVHRIQRPRSKVEGHTDSMPVSAWQTLRSLAQLGRCCASSARRHPRQRSIRGRAGGDFWASWPLVSVIWLETASRVYSLSASARLVYPIADLFIVQWPQLRQRYPKAITPAGCFRTQKPGFSYARRHGSSAYLQKTRFLVPPISHDLRHRRHHRFRPARRGC